MIFVTMCCVLAYVSTIGFHIFLFVIAVLGVLGSTGYVVRVQCTRLQSNGSRLRRRAWWIVAFAWVLFYVASVGPAAMLFERSGIANDFCGVIYGPLLFADEILPSRPIDNYADEWKRMAMNEILACFGHLDIL